jgi:hypothetical protein
MKKRVSLLVVIAIILTACTGDQGPMGPSGFDGNDGNNGTNGSIVKASAFEITVDFNAANGFSYAENYGFPVSKSDVTLAYILWEIADGKDVWRMLPQTVNLEEGVLFYNFDFTQTDVRFFLDATFDLNLLSSGDTQDQVFRVVVVPADNIDGVNISNINEVMQANSIEHFDIK